jgi:hypothetical protein
MPEQTVIAWDLESVPDLSAAARMLGLGMATEAEVREALGPGYGALVASRQPEGWCVDARPTSARYGSTDRKAPVAIRTPFRITLG